MIYDIKRDSTTRPTYRGRIKTWDNVVVDASPHDLRFLVGYGMQDVVPWLNAQKMTWTVKHDPQPTT